MKKKSKTQMTKQELLGLLSDKETVINKLQDELTTLRSDRIALDTIAADHDTSIIIASLNSRIKELEHRLGND